MRFLFDQDVYAVTARFLGDLGHDVVQVAEIGLARASDEEILNVAQEQSRILVTRDRDKPGVRAGIRRRSSVPPHIALHPECRSRRT